MQVKEFLRAHCLEGEQHDRFNEFDPERFDYTLSLKKPNGDTFILRNPSSVDGAFVDKGHTIDSDCELLAAGTAGLAWKEEKQHFIGIDIDTNDTHANGLSADKLQPIIEALESISWVEVRRSSGGSGLHVFIHFTTPVDATCRADGTALAAAVLTLMGREAGFDFKAVKDCAGGNMWIFKAGAPANAYEIIKAATACLDPAFLPPGWREAKNASQRKVEFAPSSVSLSAEHLKVEQHLRDYASTIWVPGINCYHTHTYALQEIARQHGYRGHFATTSSGTDLGKPNAYMFPLSERGFVVKRFGNAMEDPSWLDGANGQYTLLDQYLPFAKAVAHFAENKTTKGLAYRRDNLMTMLKSAGVELEIPELFMDRQFFLKINKGDVQIIAEKRDADSHMEGWTATEKSWQRSFPVPQDPAAVAEAEVLSVSNIIRAVATDTESAKWCICTDGIWTGTVSGEVSCVLAAHKIKPPGAMGWMRQEPYWLVFEPYQPEYLSGRRWNRGAPQLACQPVDVPEDTPTWDAVFDHLGSGMDEDVANDEVCQTLGITSGAHYLKLWVKLLLEKPAQRLPYLFLSSRQNNTGKTSLGASLRFLIDPGVEEINEEALVDKFTGELEGKVLCLIEELDLRDKRNKAYATLKRVLTSKTLTIRRMRTDAYTVPNFTHFIHTANDARFVPCETEDMRIVMVEVAPIRTFIESLDFENGIKRESPSMLRKLLDMPLVEPAGRFWLPVVQTSLKESVLAGLYDSEKSEAELGVNVFADKHIKKESGGSAPQPLVLKSYETFCKEQGLPAVPKTGFLSTLTATLECPIGRKQRRLDGKQVWHYTGICLKA
jgi:hypothetical protein